MSRSRFASEGGAVAVLMSILLAMVFVPLTALGISSFIREGTAAELQRSADSGALAGASRIPLGDLSFVLSYVTATQAGTGVLPDFGFGINDPLKVACDQARAALAVDDALGGDYGLPGSIKCEARYTADLEFIDKFQKCAENILAGVAPAGVSPNVLPTLSGVLPALLRPGVQVTLERRVRGPLDQLLGRSSGSFTTEKRVSRARRRFKNAVVVPVVVNPITNEPIIDLNSDVLPATRDDIVAALKTLDDTTKDTLSAVGCQAVVSALADDFRDVYNPGAGNAPTTTEVIEDAQNQGAPLLAFLFGDTSSDPLPLLTTLRIPFLDFVPVCVQQSGFAAVAPVGFAGCAASAPGAFRANLVPVPGAP